MIEAMTDYQRGYLDGYREEARPGEVAGNQTAAQEAERIALAEALDEPASDDDLGSYWVGLYHGRFHRRTGTPAQGAHDVPAGL